MTIAERKYAENIAEYVIYMWQMQDLLRAVNMDVESLDGFLRRNSAEIKSLTTRLDGREDLVRLRRCKNEHGMRRRLFKRFQ